MLDGTTRLRAGDAEVHHFLGVSCFAERCVVAEQAVLPIPADTPMEIAALLGCSVITGVGAVLNTARVTAGSRVLVIGAGGVGLSCVMGAAVAGAGQIVVVDVAPDKLELARSFGATDVIDAGAEDVVRTARRLTEGGADFAFEVIGRPETVQQAVRAIRAGGTAVAVGLAPGAATAAIGINDLVLQEKTLKGSLYGSARPVVDMPMLLRLHRQGRLPIDRLLTNRFPLSAVNDAYAALTGGQSGRSVILPTG
jgi:Zn-dependent alcohol dehydrogenase